jgi:TPR repeat protein
MGGVLLAIERAYRKLAKQGHATAQFNLGIMYDNGRGVTQDYAKAVHWYRNLPAPGRRQTLYVTLRLRRALCF